MEVIHKVIHIFLSIFNTSAKVGKRIDTTKYVDNFLLFKV